MRFSSFPLKTMPHPKLRMEILHSVQDDRGKVQDDE